MAYLLMQPKQIETTMRTPQELVHIKHTISLRQYKYWCIMLRAFREACELGLEPDEDQFYRIKLTDVGKYMGYVPKRAELKADLDALRKEAIIYNVLSKDKRPVLRGSGFISEWEISEASLGFTFPTFLSDLVRNMDYNNDMFMKLNWSIFNAFSGKYEALLWKLCRDFAGVGQTKDLALPALREYFGLRDNEYQEFKDLNKFVISGPSKRVSDHPLSDIEIEPVMSKEGRRVVSVRFLIRTKRQTALDFGDDPAFRFARIQLPLVDQRRYLEGLSSEEVELCIERANEYADELESKGEAVKIGGIYRTALENNWGKELASRKLLQEQKARKVEASRKSADKEELLERLRGEFAAERKAQAIQLVASMEPERLAERFKAYCDEKRPAPALVKKGLESPAFHAWLRVGTLPEATDADFRRWAGDRYPK